MTTDRTKETDNKTDRKTWNTPKLRIFARTRTEERVLWTCKNETSGWRSGYHHHGCYLVCDTSRCVDGTKT